MPSNPLTDVLPAQARKYLYAALFVASLGFAAWQAADGDWVEFAGAVIVALFGATATSNTDTPARDDAGASEVLYIAVAALVLAVLAIVGVRIG